MKKERIDFQRLKKVLPDLRQNVLLKDYTTFRIGGPARYFLIATTKEDFIKAVKAAKKFGLPFFILGEGSKLLVADRGYDGIVIKMQNVKCQMSTRPNLAGQKLWRARNGPEQIPSELYGASNSKFKIIDAESGKKLGDLVKLSLKQSLTGLEWAAGIPGTIGGAIRGNAGAFGKYMHDVVEEVEVFDVKSCASKRFSNKECLFAEKNSAFKKNKNLVVLSAKIKTDKGKQKGIKTTTKEYLEYRQKTQPLEFPSAGCIFINPQQAPAGLLIDQCGLKGKTIGHAKISEKHANFIINLGGATAQDVLRLIKLAKKSVKEKFDIELEEEIQHVGF